MQTRETLGSLYHVGPTAEVRGPRFPLGTHRGRQGMPLRGSDWDGQWVYHSPRSVSSCSTSTSSPPPKAHVPALKPWQPDRARMYWTPCTEHHVQPGIASCVPREIAVEVRQASKQVNTSSQAWYVRGRDTEPWRPCLHSSRTGHHRGPQGGLGACSILTR